MIKVIKRDEHEIVFSSEGKTFTVARPHHQPRDHQGRELSLASSFVQTACKLRNARGSWPDWFEWAVGTPVPKVYEQEAIEIATGKVRYATVAPW